MPVTRHRGCDTAPSSRGPNVPFAGGSARAGGTWLGSGHAGPSWRAGWQAFWGKSRWWWCVWSLLKP